MGARSEPRLLSHLRSRGPHCQISLWIREQRERAKLLIKSLHAVQGGADVVDALSDRLELLPQAQVLLSKNAILRSVPGDLEIMDGGGHQKHAQQCRCTQSLPDEGARNPVAPDGRLVVRNDNHRVVLCCQPCSRGFRAKTDP